MQVPPFRHGFDSQKQIPSENSAVLLQLMSSVGGGGIREGGGGKEIGSSVPQTLPV
jgi:hypothetical protein